MALVKTGREFETEPCGRCGGSGQYSYCQMYGTKCFGCAGAGRKLTKRGAAAREFYLSLLPTKTVAELQSGDFVTEHGFRGRVVEIAPATSWSINPETGEPREDPATLRNVVFAKVVYAGLPLTRVFRLVPTVEQADAAYAQAIAYQATLTKTGTVAKRARRAPAAAAPRPCPASVPGTWGTTPRCTLALDHAGLHDNGTSVWRGSYLAKKEAR